METVIGFVFGYLVGTRHGRDGLRKVRDSVDMIKNSPDVRQLVLTGASVAGSAMKQVLSGGAGAMLSGMVEAVSRKAGEVLADPEERTAA